MYYNRLRYNFYFWYFKYNLMPIFFLNSECRTCLFLHCGFATNSEGFSSYSFKNTDIPCSYYKWQEEMSALQDLHSDTSCSSQSSKHALLQRRNAHVMRACVVVCEVLPWIERDSNTTHLTAGLEHLPHPGCSLITRHRTWRSNC